MRGDWRRCAAIAESDSLSARSRAMVGRQSKNGRGGASNAPRPGAEGGRRNEKASPRGPLAAPPPGCRKARRTCDGGQAKGEVKERDWKSGRGYALRFWAYGERQYVTLGYEHDGWDLGARRGRAGEHPRRRSPRHLGAAERRRSRAPRPSDEGQPTAGADLRPLRPRLVASREGQVSEKTTAARKMGARAPRCPSSAIGRSTRSTSRRLTTTASSR